MRYEEFLACLKPNSLLCKTDQCERCLTDAFENSYTNCRLSICRLRKVFLLPYFCCSSATQSFVIFQLTANVTRLGDFWKFLVTNFLTKVAQMYVDFLDILKTSIFMDKLFRHYWNIFGLLYISVSGHTAHCSLVLTWNYFNSHNYGNIEIRSNFNTAN